MIRLILFIVITWYLVRFVRKVLRVATITYTSMPSASNANGAIKRDKNEIREVEYTIIDDNKS